MSLNIVQKPSVYFNKTEIAQVQAYVDSLPDTTEVPNMAKLIIHLVDKAQTAGSETVIDVEETKEYKELFADYTKVSDDYRKVSDQYSKSADTIIQLRAELAKATGKKDTPAEKPAKPADKKEDTKTDKKEEKKPDGNLSFMW
jgi:hypothetical protein